MSILVVGNGFDLYHDMETRYINFINFTRNAKEPDVIKIISDICKGNIFIRCFQQIANEEQQWIDCEKEIESIVNLVKKVIKDRKVFSDYPNHFSIVRDKTSLYPEEFEKLGLMNKLIKDSNGSRILLKDNLFTRFNWINKEKVMKILRNELNDCIFTFKYYLESKVMNKSITSLSKQIEQLKPNYVINFNYTATYRRYNIPRENVCFIHGSVEDNNIVLGTSDIDQSDIDSIYFKKYFQRIQKHTDIIDWNKFPYDVNINPVEHRNAINKENDINTTYFFGHSLSNTDGDLIRLIYKFSKKIVIFYLSNSIINDYEQKIINLIETLGKNNVINGIYNNTIEFKPIK